MEKPGNNASRATKNESNSVDRKKDLTKKITKHAPQKLLDILLTNQNYLCPSYKKECAKPFMLG